MDDSGRLWNLTPYELNRAPHVIPERKCNCASKCFSMFFLPLTMFLVWCCFSVPVFRWWKCRAYNRAFVRIRVALCNLPRHFAEYSDYERMVSRRSIDWLIDWLVDWLISRSIDCLIDSLIDWFSLFIFLLLLWLAFCFQLASFLLWMHPESADTGKWGKWREGPEMPVLSEETRQHEARTKITRQSWRLPNFFVFPARKTSFFSGHCDRTRFLTP